MAELCEDEENPFWKRLLQPEKAYGVDLTQEIAPVISQALNTGMSSTNIPKKMAAAAEGTQTQMDAAEQKKIKELAKIR